MLKPAKNIVVVQNSGTSTKQLIRPVIENDRALPEIGEVFLIGLGLRPVDFQVGDSIAYRKYTDNFIIIDGKKFNFIKFDDILAVIVKEEDN